MTPTAFTDAAIGYAAAFRPQFDQFVRLAEPPVETDIADRITGWLDLCRADPAAAFEEDTLGRMLKGLVTLMHSRMTFGIARCSAACPLWRPPRDRRHRRCRRRGTCI